MSEISDITAQIQILSTFFGHCLACACNQAINYEMFYVTNEYFEWERWSHAADVVFERAARWFERVEFTDQDHMSVNRRGCRTIYLSIVAVKQKEILLSVIYLFSYKYLESFLQFVLYRIFMLSTKNSQIFVEKLWSC